MINVSSDGNVNGQIDFSAVSQYFLSGFCILAYCEENCELLPKIRKSMSESR